MTIDEKETPSEGDDQAEPQPAAPAQKSDEPRGGIFGGGRFDIDTWR